MRDFLSLLNFTVPADTPVGNGHAQKPSVCLPSTVAIGPIDSWEDLLFGELGNVARMGGEAGGRRGDAGTRKALAVDADWVRRSPAVPRKVAVPCTKSRVRSIQPPPLGRETSSPSAQPLTAKMPPVTPDEPGPLTNSPCRRISHSGASLRSGGRRLLQAPHPVLSSRCPPRRSTYRLEARG